MNFRSYVGSLRVTNCGEKLRNLIFLFSSSMLHLSSHLEKEVTWIWGLDKNYLERGISLFVQQFTFVLNCWSLCYSLFRSNISIFIYNDVLFVKFECLILTLDSSSTRKNLHATNVIVKVSTDKCHHPITD